MGPQQGTWKPEAEGSELEINGMSVLECGLEEQMVELMGNLFWASLFSLQMMEVGRSLASKLSPAIPHCWRQPVPKSGSGTGFGSFIFYSSFCFLFCGSFIFLIRVERVCLPWEFRKMDKKSVSSPASLGPIFPSSHFPVSFFCGPAWFHIYLVKKTKTKTQSSVSAHFLQTKY